MKLLKRFKSLFHKCKHNWVTVGEYTSDFCNDLIPWVPPVGKRIITLVQCTKCGRLKTIKHIK